ncbi:MAG: B12-binding domain-containing radical SAM protein [Candidatus Riflebacteria bacterium]|nr:B12-binding domain-containing radical SAM protein [Candidatus Riflebacteria bacterium]
MRVALIDPSYRHEGRLMKFRRVGYFPLTLPRLAACFPPDITPELLYEKCHDVNPATGPAYDLVLFAIMGANLAHAIELSAGYRARGIKTVVGGFATQAFFDMCRSGFDSVVLGDGEEVIPRMIDDFRAGRLASMYENPAPSIERLPVPRYDLVPQDVVGNIIPIEASRGCPNACDFCSVTLQYQRTFRKRAPDEVLRDFDAARAVFGRRVYYFTDPNFTADLAHAKTILRGLIGKNILWLASVDVHPLADDEFLSLARRSGCFNLQIGFETLSPHELEESGKGFAARTDYPALIRRAHSFGIPVTALMMVGFDSDTPATFGRMQHFAEKNHLSFVVTHPLIPIPGTPLHEKLSRQKRLKEIDPADANGLYISFLPKHFTESELLECYWRFSTRMQSLRSIVRRFLWPGVFRNPIAYLIMLLTNFAARSVIARRLPPGAYE